MEWKVTMASDTWWVHIEPCGKKVHVGLYVSVEAFFCMKLVGDGDAILLVPVVHIKHRINFYLLGSVADFSILLQLRPAVY